METCIPNICAYWKECETLYLFFSESPGILFHHIFSWQFAKRGIISFSSLHLQTFNNLSIPGRTEHEIYTCFVDYILRYKSDLFIVIPGWYEGWWTRNHDKV